MTYEKSNEIVESTLKDMRAIFLSKGAEYSINKVDDRFYLFRLMLNEFKPQEVEAYEIAGAMLVLRSKQEVCINELIQMLKTPSQLQESKRTKAYIDEKFNDFLIYTMLLKSLVYDNYEIKIEKETI